ncbi:unnamed protein product, partial [Musa textilis]
SSHCSRPGSPRVEPLLKTQKSEGRATAQDPEDRWSRRRSRPYNRTTVRDKGSSHCSRPGSPRVEPLLK